MLTIVSDPEEALVNKLEEIDVFIFCIPWEFLEDQVTRIAAAKEAG